MVLTGDLINFRDTPQLSMASLSDKQTLKRKLKTELAHVRAAVENIVAGCEKLNPKKLTIVHGHSESKVNAFPSNAVSTIDLSSKSSVFPSLHCGSQQYVMSKKRRTTEMRTKQNASSIDLIDKEVLLTEKSEAGPGITATSEKFKLGNVAIQSVKMDSSKIRQCANILKALMNHPTGWVFNQPVDTVKLNIPDYFSIITEPMDLGTVKQKLEKKQYSSTAQFAADVVLTFSNAMRYNPPSNQVHVMAKELNDIFNSRWKLLETKWKMTSSISPPHSSTKPGKVIRVVHKKSACSNTSPRKSLTSTEKLKLRKDLSSIQLKNMPQNVLRFLKNKCLLAQSKDCFDVDINMFDEETLWELHQAVKSWLDAKHAKIDKYVLQPGQDPCKDSAGTLVQSNADTKAFMSSLARVKDIHGDNMECECRPCQDLGQMTSLSDVDFEKSVKEHHVYPTNSCSQDCKRTTPNVEVDLSSQKGEASLPCEQQLSPNRALRAARLKSRFADTILKAQQRALGEKVDPAKLQLEREKLEKMQQEEKARIEAHVKAVESAARMKAEAEVKLQREREREAARLALQKMERTVDIDNSYVLTDLRNLGRPPPGHFDMPDDVLVDFMNEFELQSGAVNPLEQLGLFIKKDADEEADDWNNDVEEGEIDH